MTITPLNLRKAASPLVVLWIVICAVLLWQGWAAAASGLGDSDDAMRLVIVRDLAAGRGWYDQKIVRLQPPGGVWLHWSRLLDGVLAVLLCGLRPLLGQARAEFYVRLLWPLALLPPLLWSTRTIIGELNTDPVSRFRARLAAAAMVLVCLPLYAQFHPGRIDHHNVQIVLWLIAVAGASKTAAPEDGRHGDGRGSAAVAGAAIGLGLAIGFEAIVFEAVIAAYMALMMLVRPQEARRVRVFAMALGATVAVAFLVQTPPQRWGVSACDALGLNVALGVTTGAVLIAAASFRSRRRDRLALTLAGAAMAAASCLALHPACVRGPFADVDPRIFTIWLRGVQETLSIPQLLHGDFATGLTLLVAVIYAPAAWMALGFWRSVRTTPAYYLMGAMLLIAAISTFAMLRMSSYLMWAAVPSSATLAALVAQKLSRTARTPPLRILLLGLLLAPNLPASVFIAADRLRPRPTTSPRHGLDAASAGPDLCFSAVAYEDLARLRPGVTAAETDLGAFILAYTPSRVLSAPYHRADAGILAADAILSAPAETRGARGAFALARASHVDYILTCPAHAARDDAGLPLASLRAALDAGATPAWLVRISPPRHPLQVFQVAPQTRTSSRNALFVQRLAPISGSTAATP